MWHVQIQAVEMKRGIEFSGGGGGGGDDDGDSKDDWNESAELSESDDEMGYCIFGYAEPASIDSQIKQPKVSKDRLGSIFSVQQLVRRSLTVLGTL